MTKDYQPAFPYTPHPNRHELDRCDPGMSLRDWFAGVMLAQCAQTWCDCNPVYSANVAARCYEFADAMLEARK